MALINGRDMFDEILFEINKEETATLWPRQAIWLINRASFLWLKEQAKLVELNQKSMDDIASVRGKATSAAFVNSQYNLSGLAGYYRLLLLRVKMSDTDDCIDNDEWYKVLPMRTNERNTISRNPYRKESVKKLYYDIIGTTLSIYGCTPTVGWIEYLKRVNEVTNVELIPTPMSMYPDSDLREICVIAARIYLKRHESPAYELQLNELAIEKQSDI